MICPETDVDGCRWTFGRRRRCLARLCAAGESGRLIQCRRNVLFDLLRRSLRHSLDMESNPHVERNCEFRWLMPQAGSGNDTTRSPRFLSFSRKHARRKPVRAVRCVK